MKIIVVGAGIVGVSCAIWLQRSGHDVTIVDRVGPAGGTSHGNAGVLAAGAVVPVTTPGLLRKAPGMLFSRDAPLFLRWSYLPRLLPFLVRYLGYANDAHVDRYASAMSALLHDTLEQHRSLARGTDAARFISDDDYCFGYATRADFDYELTELNAVLPSMTDRDAPVVQTVTKAIEDIMGKSPEYVASPGTYDQKHIDRIGKLKNCIAYGPGILDLAHQPDEYVGIDDMKDSAKVMALVLVDLLLPD